MKSMDEDLFNFIHNKLEELNPSLYNLMVKESEKVREMNR